MALSARARLVQRLFPEGIPRLWCPPLTHFRAALQLAPERMAAHLRHIGRHTRGWLIPGSTGEGWQMCDDEVRAVLDHALTIAPRVGARVLVGVLRQDAESAIECIEQTSAWLCRRAGKRDVQQALVAQHVCGFTVCPPTGRERSSEDLDLSLRSVLALNQPTALYQLPQVTQNEMPAELIAELAAEFPNFYLLKDTSGQDRVAMSGADLQDVFLVRGAEGDYARWLKSASGPYDGFLLSTANVFADRLADMMRLQDEDRAAEAQATIAPLERAVREVFELVKSVPWGNPFTNANKAMDHFMAFGDTASCDAGPTLHDGQILPRELLESIREVLRRHQLLPAVGYLALA